MQTSSLTKIVSFSQIGCRSQRSSVVSILTKRYLNLGRRNPQMLTTNDKFNAFQLSYKSFSSRALKIKSCPGITANCFVRQFHGRSQEFAGKRTLEKLRMSDGVPKSYEMIYRSNFPSYLLFSQIFVFLSAGAVITAGLIYLLQEEKTEEEKQLIHEKQLEAIRQKVQRDKEITIAKLVQDYKDKRDIKDAPSGPDFEDFLEGGTLQFVILLGSFIVLAGGLFRIQRFLPVRIYANNKDHCIAVMYGHILPGKLTWHEFLAGTVKPFGGRRKLDFFSSSVYKDGSGKSLILLEQFFRSPEDYNRVMGFNPEVYDDMMKSDQHEKYNK